MYFFNKCLNTRLIKSCMYVAFISPRRKVFAIPQLSPIWPHASHIWQLHSICDVIKQNEIKFTPKVLFKIYFVKSSHKLWQFLRARIFYENLSIYPYTGFWPVDLWKSSLILVKMKCETLQSYKRIHRLLQKSLQKSGRILTVFDKILPSSCEKMNKSKIQSIRCCKMAVKNL